MTLQRPEPAPDPTLGVTGQSRDVLLRALTDESPDWTIARIASRLGLVGEAADIAPLLAAVDRTAGTAKDQVSFAAALIAHRLGCEGPPLSFPDPVATLLPAGEATPITGRPVTDDERRAVLDGLQREPTGLSGDAAAICRVDCGRRAIFLVLGEVVVATPSTLTATTALVGVAFEMTETTGRTSPSMLLMSRPAADGFDLFVSRLRGEPLYRGSGTISARGVVGTIAAVDAIGVAAAEMTFEVAGSDLRLTGTTEAVIRHTRQPARATDGPAENSTSGRWS